MNAYWQRIYECENEVPPITFDEPKPKSLGQLLGQPDDPESDVI